MPDNVYVPVMRSMCMAELAATFWGPNSAKGQPGLATVPYRAPTWPLPWTVRSTSSALTRFLHLGRHSSRCVFKDGLREHQQPPASISNSRTIVAVPELAVMMYAGGLATGGHCCCCCRCSTVCVSWCRVLWTVITSACSVMDRLVLVRHTP